MHGKEARPDFRRKANLAGIDAHHVRPFPGRKTDVADSYWLAQQVRYGLVRDSFIPPRDLRELHLLGGAVTGQQRERRQTQ